MRYLLDTNHWSFLQEEHPRIVARIRQLPEDASLFMSVVSQAELLGGAELVASEKRRRELLLLYRQAVATATEVLPITSEIAEEFARVHVALRRKGKPIETNDIWLAATARAHDLIVATTDPDFRHVDGLPLEDWGNPPAAQ